MKVRLLNWDGSIYLGVLFETEVPARSHLKCREQLSGIEEAEKLHFLTFLWKKLKDCGTKILIHTLLFIFF
jgi:hypothetical protein